MNIYPNRIQTFAGIMQLLLGWQPQHNHYHADLEWLEILEWLWIFCRNQLIFFGCCPQRNELHSHIVCDWLWPNVTYKECGCSKISSHSNLSLVFLQPSQSTRCCQLCAQRRWKKYQMVPAVCTKKAEEIIYFNDTIKKYSGEVWYPL